MSKASILGFVFGLALGAVGGVAATSSYFKNQYEDHKTEYLALIDHLNRKLDENEVKILELKEFKKKSKAYSPEEPKSKMGVVFNKEFAEMDYKERDRVRYVAITTKEEFVAEEDGYERYMWTYWTKDEVVSDEEDKVIIGYSDFVGETFKHLFAENPELKVVYVRNDDYECYYEIERIDEFFFDQDPEEGNREPKE